MSAPNHSRTPPISSSRRCRRCLVQQFFSRSSYRITFPPNLWRLLATVDCQTPLTKKKTISHTSLPFFCFSATQIQIQIFCFPLSPHASSRCFSLSLLFHIRTKSGPVFISIAASLLLVEYLSNWTFSPPLLATTTTTTPINTSTFSFLTTVSAFVDNEHSFTTGRLLERCLLSCCTDTNVYLLMTVVLTKTPTVARSFALD